MSKIIALFLLVVLCQFVFGQVSQEPTPPPTPGFVYVHGYYTRTGRYIHGHFRKLPLHRPVKHYPPRKKDAYQKMRSKIQWDKTHPSTKNRWDSKTKNPLEAKTKNPWETPQKPKRHSDATNLFKKKKTHNPYAPHKPKKSRKPKPLFPKPSRASS